jgi:hypothetical protein
MKKTLLIIAVAGLAMASCRKDRTCTCVTSSTAPGYVSSTQVTVMKSVKKNFAYKNCLTRDVQTTAPVSGYVQTETCTLK